MNDSSSIQPQSQDWRQMLTAAERAAMLQDIACVSLAAGAKLFPEQPWTELSALPEASAPPKSPVEQLSFVEALLPRLSQGVRQIMQSPLASAASCTRLVRPASARRVTPAAWMSHARQSRSQPPLCETVTLFSPDTPENRAVKSFLSVLTRDCHAAALMAQAEEEAEAVGRALVCLRRLGQLTCEDWWKEVAARRGDWMQPPTQRGILRADYAAVFRMASQYRHGFRFEWDHPLLRLPPRETWQLYETWCFFRVLQTLRELGWDFTPMQEAFAVRTGRLMLTLAAGQPSKIALESAQGRPLTLTYNQTFAEGRESLTHTMRPDITLSDGGRLWVLDAKFKPYAEPGEEGGDINQMHAYKDGIVAYKDGIAGSRGQSVVARAWCLYAGLAGTQNRTHITYGRGAETSVGALCLRPGPRETSSPLRELLQQWLA